MIFKTTVFLISFLQMSQFLRLQASALPRFAGLRKPQHCPYALRLLARRAGLSFVVLRSAQQGSGKWSTSFLTDSYKIRLGM